MATVQPFNTALTNLGTSLDKTFNVTPIPNASHADGYFFAVLVLSVLIIFFSVILMDEWDKVRASVVAANATSPPDATKIQQCQDSYDKRTMMGLSLTNLALAFIAFILTFVIFLKSRNADNPFTGRGGFSLFLGLGILASASAPAIMNAYKPDKICGNPKLPTVSFGASFAAIIFSCFSILLSGSTLNADVISHMLKKGSELAKISK